MKGMKCMKGMHSENGTIHSTIHGRYTSEYKQITYPHKTQMQGMYSIFQFSYVRTRHAHLPVPQT